jgi:eukaryotic-like serine/threonine-protein kinase
MRKMIREKEPVRPSTRVATLGAEQLTTTAKRRSVDTSKLLPQLRGDLDSIVMKCLEKDRTRRYETANGLAADLKRHLNNEPVLARPPSRLYEFQKSVRRHKAGFAATAAMIIVLAFGVLISTWQAARARLAEREQIQLRELAETARAGEAVQRREAEAAQANERHLRKVAELQAYAANMKAAQAALQQNSREQSVALLNQYWPKPGETDLRGIEWRYLWQAAQGDQLYSWKHPGMVAGAHFAPNGREVATACFDGVLRIWNVASGKLVAQFDRGVSDDLVLISFEYAPDGSTLASISPGGIVLLDCATWQVKETLELPEFERGPIAIVSLTYSPDGRWLAASLDRQSVRIWNSVNWESYSLPAPSFARIRFSPDSKRLAVCNGDIDLWNLEERVKEATLSAPSDVSGGQDAIWFEARFSPNGEHLIAADYRGHLAWWDVLSGRVAWIERAHSSRVYGLAVSHDGRRFASGGFDQLIHIWDAVTQEKIMTLHGHLNEIWSLEFSRDDRYLLTSSKDGSVRLWDAQRKPQPNYWMLDDEEWPLGYTPDGRGLISITGDGRTLRHWNGPRMTKSFPTPLRIVARKAVFTPGSQDLYAAGPDDVVQVFDVNTLKAKRAVKISEPVNQLYHVSPDERWLAGRTQASSELFIWSAASGEVVARIPGFEISNSFDLAVFSPDSRVLAFATDQREVKLWDTTTQKTLRTLNPHPWKMNAISFSPDGRLVASSSWAGEVRIFEVASGREPVPPLVGPGSGVHAHSFSPDGATLIAGADDSSVRFWSVATGREMLMFGNSYNNFARLPFVSPTGELVVWRDLAQNLRVRVSVIPTLAEIERAQRAESTVR